MSGGVDSSVAAALLAKEGHEVVGVTMRLLPSGKSGFGCCGSPDDLQIAKRSAEAAGILHYVLDYAPDFERDVINYFVTSYLDGETPNPCLACNQYIKFDKLQKFADSIGASHLATGHYARILKSADSPRYHLFEAKDSTKDQSYVLYTLDQKSLSQTLFPLGNIPKTEVRRIAAELTLPNAAKKDSQEICFIPGNDYRDFLEDNIQNKSLSHVPSVGHGMIKDSTGRIVGEHRGVAFYTVGQRHSLNLTTQKKHYVTRIDAKTNTLFVGLDEDTLSWGLTARQAHWISGAASQSPFEALVKIRYKHVPAAATITPSEDGFEVSFHAQQRAVSPGQAAVIYQWDEKLGAREVLGGGKIEKVLS